MVNYYDTRMDDVFVALSDGTRRAMIARLSRGPASIGELGRGRGVTKAAITKHVKLLERARLVRRERRGRVHHVMLAPAPLKRAQDWIERHREFWQKTLDRLVRYVDELNLKGDSQ